jgi:hypothetical protein
MVETALFDFDEDVIVEKEKQKSDDEKIMEHLSRLSATTLNT